MKTLNQFRNTESFKITGVQFNQMALVYKFLEDQGGTSVIGIANDPENLSLWTVRVDERVCIEDLLLEIRGKSVVIKDRAIIHKISSIA